MASFQGKNYYEILGVGSDASDDDIRKAYRTLARKLHPDVNKAADASEQFSKVQEAYEILSESEKRAAYDNYLRYGVRSGGSADRGGSQWQSTHAGFDPSEFASIFEQFVASGGIGGRAGAADDFGFSPSAGRRSAGMRPQRGRDLRHQISVSFMTAALGGHEKIRLTIDGSSQQIDVRIPPGIEDGARLRLKGRGHAGLNTGPPGDLILRIEVGDHPVFRRDGLDLLVDVPISIVEAVLGTLVSVPLLSGRVEIRVPPRTPSGRRLRVKGQGIDNGKEKGNLYAVVQIVPPGPDELTAEDQSQLEELGKRLKNPRDSAAPPDTI